MNLLEPPGLWQKVRQHLAVPGAVGWLLAIAVVGAFGVTVAAEIGVRIFNTEWSQTFGYSARPDAEGTRSRMLWLALALAPLFQALVGVMILPLYGLERRWREAIGVAVVGTIPLYAAGLALVVLPGILIVLFAYFISFAWWTSGVRELLGVSRADAFEFVTVTVLASGVALLVCSVAAPL